MANKTIVGFNKPLTEEIIRKLPNHLKSILLSNSSNGAVKADKIKSLRSNEFIGKIEQESENKFNFEMLKQIERLSGYAVDRKGRVLIKNPIWKVLTQKDYDSLIGKEIVCRMIRYENKDVGLAINKGLKTPSYDDYFILIPSAVRKNVSQINIPNIPNIKKTDLQNRFKNILREALPGIEIINRDKKRTSTDLILTNLAAQFTLVDTNEEIEVVSRESKKSVKVKGHKIDVSIDIIADALVLDCQVTNIDQEYMNSNIIGIAKFDNLIKQPEIMIGIVNKQKTIIKEFDEIEADKCSSFGKYRPNTIKCQDN